jgi:translocation and assembly module TamA
MIGALSDALMVQSSRDAPARSSQRAVKEVLTIRFVHFFADTSSRLEFLVQRPAMSRMDKSAVDNSRVAVPLLQTSLRSCQTAFILLGWIILALGTAMPVTAQQVTFDVPGASETLSDDLRNASEATRLAQLGGTDPQDLLAAARADFARLLNVLYRDGRYGGQIAIEINGRPIGSLSPFATPSQISSIQIRIAPGPQFLLGTARIAPLASGTVLPEEFAPGSRAFSGTIQDTTTAAIVAWRELGFAQVRVARQDIVADHSRSELDVVIDLNPGKRLSFGTLVISGNDRTSPQRIRQIAGLPEGAVFSPKAIQTAADRLRATGAFSSVSLREQTPNLGSDTLDVAVQLTEAPLRRLGAGAEIASEEGLSLSAFWMHRNLFGGAERLRFDAEINEIGGALSGLDYRIAGAFRRPGTFAPGTDLVARSALERDDGPSALSDRFSVYLGLERKLSSDLTAEIGLEYLAEDINRRPGQSSYRILSLPALLGFDTRDDVFAPTDGTLAQVELRPYLGMMDAGDGLRAYTDFRAYRALGSRLVIAGRLQWGAVFGSSIAQTPSDYLFSSGGSGTVRGQPFGSLGTSAGGSFTGGRSFFGGSIEARLRVTDTIGLVAFYDQAFVGADSLPFGNGASHRGYGMGLRYQTAIGALRLDVGLPGGGETRPKLYLGIGQAF